MKILFLDIDGVLNTPKTPNPRKLPYVVDKILLRRLKALLARTGAKVVLSSTWRYDPAGLFSARHHGIPFSSCVPDLPRRSRGDEIRLWLKRHPRVTRFAVIDDDDDGLDDLPLFQPNPRDGLTSLLARRVSAYLTGKSNSDMRRSVVVRVAEELADTLAGHKG